MLRLVAVEDQHHRAPTGGQAWRIAVAGNNGAYASLAGWEHYRFASYSICAEAIDAISKKAISPIAWRKRTGYNGRKVWHI